MRKQAALGLLAFLVFTIPVSPQEKTTKFAVFVTGLEDASPVLQSLIKMMKDSKPFEPVTKEDPSKVVVLISCMPRKQTNPFVCMYVAQYNGPAFKTFLGGGLYGSASADSVANDFLGSIAQDIVERFDSKSTENLREALESCLLMTDSKCNVPDPLQKDFGTKQLTLGQYLLKKNQ
jgi:hypothetical protein